MIRRPPRSTLDRSSAASDVYKRQAFESTIVEEGNWKLRPGMPEQWHIQYRHEAMSLRLRLGLTAFKHVGVFPEQADNWNFIYDTLMQWPEGPQPQVLNLFAYTCGIGVVAASAGAEYVVNVDFAESNIGIGKENARLNELPIRMRFVQSDAFAAMRQLAGIGQPKMVRGKHMPVFPKLEKRAFDLVFLDPPRYAKSPFGVVDIINDYAALMKLALLCTVEGGTLICCNNAVQISREFWADQLQRCATKAGRTIRELEWITPEEDFPSHDGQPPLKIALLRV